MKKISKINILSQSNNSVLILARWFKLRTDVLVYYVSDQLCRSKSFSLKIMKVTQFNKMLLLKKTENGVYLNCSFYLYCIVLFLSEPKWYWRLINWVNLFTLNIVKHQGLNKSCCSDLLAIGLADGFDSSYWGY